jgi:hypothetical protein
MGAREKKQGERFMGSKREICFGAFSPQLSPLNPESFRGKLRWWEWR